MEEKLPAELGEFVGKEVDLAKAKSVKTRKGKDFWEINSMWTQDISTSWQRTLGKKNPFSDPFERDDMSQTPMEIYKVTTWVFWKYFLAEVKGKLWEPKANSLIKKIVEFIQKIDGMEEETPEIITSYNEIKMDYLALMKEYLKSNPKGYLLYGISYLNAELVVYIDESFRIKNIDIQRDGKRIGPTCMGGTDSINDFPISIKDKTIKSAIKRLNAIVTD